MAGDAASPEPKHLVLYDGACGLCDRTVQWILAHDPERRFHFAPLQGPTAAAVRTRHAGLPTDLDSVIYVDRSSGTERVFARSEAVSGSPSDSRARPVWIGWAAWLPRWLTDLGIV